MEAAADLDIVPRKRTNRLGRLGAWALVITLAVAAGAFVEVERRLREPLPVPSIPAIDIWPRFFDLRPLEIVTTVNWQKIPMRVSRRQLLIDQTLWQRMHFEDWDRLPADVRMAALDRLIVRYGHLVAAWRMWPVMTAADWDDVPQPIRAMAFVSMIEHWVDAYEVGRTFGLDRHEVRQTVKAIAMSESWFDHRARGVNADGSVDIGLGGASGFARQTIRRWYTEGRSDFSLDDEEYFNPWLASRSLTFWFDVVLHEANGDLGLAVRAYNWGIGRAMGGAGDAYLASVERRRSRYFEGPSRSPTWRRLSIFRRFQMDAKRRPASTRGRAADSPSSQEQLVAARTAGNPATVDQDFRRLNRASASRVVTVGSTVWLSACRASPR
jgi:hypothetical protein